MIKSRRGKIKSIGKNLAIESEKKLKPQSFTSIGDRDSTKKLASFISIEVP